MPKYGYLPRRSVRARMLEFRRVWWALSIALWVAGVVIFVAQSHALGCVVAGVGAAGILFLAWTRGASWLPDGGGPLGP